MSIDCELEIALCDDNETDLLQIEAMTSGLLRAENISCHISTFSDSAALLNAIREGYSCHLFLLDVLMDGMDGMELDEELRKLGDKAHIVFISVSCEMAIRGYEVEASRYLSKPLAAEKLKDALLYCYRQIRKKKEILLPTETGLRRYCSRSFSMWRPAVGKRGWCCPGKR